MPIMKAEHVSKSGRADKISVSAPTYFFSSPAPTHPIFGPAPLHFSLSLRSNALNERKSYRPMDRESTENKDD